MKKIILCLSLSLVSIGFYTNLLADNRHHYDDDDSLYDKNRQGRDWEYRQNWRWNREAYLHGEPQNEYNEDHRKKEEYHDH